MKIKMPYKGITSFIDIVNTNPASNIKVCEIGVYEGVTTKLYAQTIKNCGGELWALDNFEGEDLAKRNPNFDNRTWLEKHPGNFHPKAPLDNNWNKDLLDRFKYNLKEYEDIITIVKGETENTIKTLPDDYFDIIFIDAAHDYWSVLEDINNCISKIKKGGILSGHDINDEIYYQFKKDGRAASKIKASLSHEKLCTSKWGVALAVYEVFGSSAEVIGQGPDRIWVVCDRKFNSNWRN